MKYTTKHGLITCLGLAIVAMLLPWFTASVIFDISGFQLGCAYSCILGGIGNFADYYALGSALLGGLFGGAATLSFWQGLAVTLTLTALVAPFVMTVVSLFMAIYADSKKAAVAELVMQSLCSVIGLAYVIILVRNINMINDVTIASMGVGSYLYLAASVAALIVSIILVKRYVNESDTPVPAGAKTGVMCTAGEYLGVTIPLEKSTDVVIIGRDASCCNLVLSGAKISRKHCEISYSTITNRYRVVDYSSNGTYIRGGSRLEKDRATDLLPGTVIYLGNEMNSFCLK